MQRLMSLPLAVVLFGASIFAAPVRAPRISLIYATAETSTSAAVVWNTNVASDSLLQYSTSNPVPGSAPQMYVANQVTYHEIPLTALSPGTVYYYKATSCNRKGCVTATGSFETSPSCPDVVPPVSGSWQNVNSPNVSGVNAVNNELLGVAAVSENDVWAVGWAQDPAGPTYVKQTLIERFNGNSWNIVPSLNPVNAVQSVLYSVSAVSANDVWAVGSSHNGSAPSRTLIEHWDGTQWSIVPSPNPDSQLNELRSVAAISTSNVWAVGYRGGTRNATPLETLILHWDGSSWSQVASPNVAGANELSGITAISSNDIWAVGSAGGAPLAMHWNGDAWTIFPMQVSSGLSSERLTAVAGTVSNDIWAVGQGKGFFSNRTSAKIWHWDGARWTQKLCYALSASNPPDGYEGDGGPDTYFTGVAAAASNNVWAVGALGSGPTILHWDGQAWTRVTHPRVFPNSAALRGVTASQGGTIWSVGVEIEFDSSGSVTRTLVDRYTP